MPDSTQKRSSKPSTVVWTVLVVLVLIPLVLFGGVIYRSVSDVVDRLASESSEQLARAATAQLILNTKKYHPTLRDTQVALQLVRDSQPELENLYVINAGGQIVAHSDLGRVGLPASTLHPDLTGARLLSGAPQPTIVPSTKLGEKALRVVVPITLGATNGWVVAVRPLDRRNAVIAQITRPILICFGLIALGGLLLAYRLGKLGERIVKLNHWLKSEVSERRRAEHERNESRLTARKAREQAEAHFQRARKLNVMKDEFLATWSHELRTPIQVISGFAEILQQEELAPEERKSALEAILKKSREQAELIEGVLDFSRLLSGDLELHSSSVDLAPVIENVIKTNRLAAAAKGIALRSHVEGNPGPIKGDARRLRQILWNLVTNAIKFTSEGGRVDVRLRRSDSHLELSVSDTGQGIPADVMPGLFESFGNIDNSTTRKQGGLGLGLSFVRNLVELHGGVIRAESSGVGRGATFTVRLPIAGMTSQAEPAASTIKFPKEPAPTPKPTARPDEVRAGLPAKLLRGISVLVVDDDPDILALIVLVLRSHGAEVRSARSAEEALAMSALNEPQVLLSDIGMPGEDGYALLRRLREREGTGHHVPAAALTAYADAEDRRKVLAAGFQAHIAKPVNVTDLVQSIAQLAHGPEPGPYVGAHS